MANARRLGIRASSDPRIAGEFTLWDFGGVIKSTITYPRKGSLRVQQDLAKQCDEFTAKLGKTALSLAAGR
jgi:hypothetical protein